MLRDPMHERVLQAWREARWALGIGPDDAALHALVARYEEPHRRYHDLSHVDACLALLDAHRAQATRVGEVAMALFFHDAVYDPQRTDNEAKSAALAHEALSRAAIDPAALARIEAMILATADHRPGTESDTALLLDLDLSILGAPSEVFERFERAIRAEYAFVPADDYRAGRSKVLAGFAAREVLFHTPALRDAYDATARANLAGAIGTLG